MGLWTFPSPDISPRTFTPGLFLLEKNANNFVEIEAGMIKQYFPVEAGLMKQFVVNYKLDW